ncbi:hypothetical protein IOD16_24135 [Saccharothrix sp. 6-C]|uniref:hypothetical protein n=1 Tax=Saccharothrix sp. 6-C TaxID=2781735 RepID=UPI0019172A71|nr:hypothetical protein [Saccharothrix sp. 6-C]QQQ74275.1 hypothetical protein IOD16_24135 [Saccharothrix sp. 6-C]
MSTPTETKIDFVDENTETVETVQGDGTAAPVAPETTPEQPGHEHHHHRLENGELSPLCSGGGCVDSPPAK